MIGILGKQIPHGNKQQREGKDYHADYTHIRPDERGHIVIVGILQKIEYTCRDYHCGGRIVGEYHYAALKHACRGGIRALGIPDLWERVIPLLRYKALYQALLAHRERIYAYAVYLFSHNVEQLGLRLAVHITDNDIRLCLLARRMRLHCEGGVPYPAANEGGVKHYSLHKAVVSAAQHPVVLRLVDRAGGIGSCIYHYRLGEALDYHTDRAREHRRDELHSLGDHIRLHIWHIGVGKGSGVGKPLYHVVRGLHKISHYFLHKVILTEAVDQIEPRPPAADLHFSAQQVKARL